MPSFGEHTRLDVLYVAVVVAVLTSASKGEKPRCEFGLAAGRPGRMPPWSGAWALVSWARRGVTGSVSFGWGPRRQVWYPT